jgi:hypothetical protein
MKKILLLMTGAILILLSSCSHENQPTKQQPNDKVQTNEWYEVTDVTYIDIPQCRQMPFSHWVDDTTLVRNEPSLYLPDSVVYDMIYVINDTNGYKTLILLSQFPECSLPNIDFSQYTLLGSYIECGGGQQPLLTRMLEVNDSLKLYKYHVSVRQMDWADVSNLFSMNWVLIPKIPNDYTVIFTRRIYYP